MKVTQVAIRPTQASENVSRPSLTPELLAACGARYSRSNEGLEAILAKIDYANLDKSVDSIFKMIDYGHQSIADMVPVSLFIDEISIFLAYVLWTLCPTAGGQESSTRYIKLTPEGVISPELLGIEYSKRAEWQDDIGRSFDAYQDALSLWEEVAIANPDVSRIPHALLTDTSEKATKQVARMKRNFGFDRARYFLPVAASTNIMMVMSARGWVQLCQHLLSHYLPEAQMLGQAIRAELELSAPRLIKHATEKQSYKQGQLFEFEGLSQHARLNSASDDASHRFLGEAPCTPHLDIMVPDGMSAQSHSEDLQFHDNRYAWIGTNLKRTMVRFKWDAVSFAEIRDLNRHRTGTKYCPLQPLGFYCASDKLTEATSNSQLHTALEEIARVGEEVTQRALSLLQAGVPDYIYRTVLGTQFSFEHITSADKFIYEAELRTGTGAHFRYAKHLHDILQLWYSRFPDTRDLILEGSAEPE